MSINNRHSHFIASLRQIADDLEAGCIRVQQHAISSGTDCEPHKTTLTMEFIEVPQTLPRLQKPEPRCRTSLNVPAHTADALS